MKRNIQWRWFGVGMCAFLFSAAQAQRPTIDDIIRDPSNNYNVIQQKAEAYFRQYGTEGTGWKEYNRWAFLVRNNIGIDGTLPDMVQKNQEALDVFRTNNIQPSGATGIAGGIANWTPWGQANPTIQAGDAQNGVGSIRCIERVGNDFWVGTPGGGIWFADFVSGSNYNWSARADGIPNLAVQEVRVAPTNASIMYALTGAVGGASGYRSTGVLKSVDGGNTWQTTGLSFPENGGVKGYKLVINPGNANIVWAGTDNGLFRTTDGGTTWANVTYFLTVGGAQTALTSPTYDLIYQPGSTTTMYATSAGPYFYKSTDGGITFQRIDRATAGLPTTGGRCQIGVTSANSNYVYLLYGTGSVFQGLYLSTNAGSSFSLRSNSPNVLGSQAWRNISIAVSPTNAADVYVGGLDVYKSTNSGTNWTQLSDWATGTASFFCHADIFDMYCDATYLYAATDGGLYRMTRSTDSWVSLNNTMQIAQAYRLGIDPTAAAAFVTLGTQDNGTYRNSGATYLSIGGGDGMETVVKPSNTNVIYLSTQNGNFYRSDDGGSTNTFIFGSTQASTACGGCSDGGNWTTPIVLRPGADNSVYIGYRNIYYNNSSGTGAWSFINTGFATAIESLEFAPSANTILYATDGATVKRFNESGGVWSMTTITGTLPALTNIITELSVDPNNSAHVVICLGGYSATQKVYETFNANAASPTWTSIVRNLPNVPVNCVVINNDAVNSIYIGTDIGVFVTNDNLVNWIMYNNGLPTTRVYDLEINTAAATDKIFAATFGRGIFSADTYTGCTASTTLSGSITGLNYTEVSATINSTQSIWGGAGTSVSYNAGTSIQLNPGFVATEGSKFEAYLQGCTGAGAPPRPLRLAAPATSDAPPDWRLVLAEGDVPQRLIPAPARNRTPDNTVPKPEGDITTPALIPTRPRATAPTMARKTENPQGE
jgi:hypothetical protein